MIVAGAQPLGVHVCASAMVVLPSVAVDKSLATVKLEAGPQP
jgi:hypothetical protein